MTRGKLRLGFASLTKGILRNGLPLAVETWEAFQREMGWKPSDVDKVFTHQVSAVHQNLFMQSLKLDRAKGFSTVEYLGNIGSVSLPVSVAIAIDNGHLKPGDKAAMIAAGSGFELYHARSVHALNYMRADVHCNPTSTVTSRFERRIGA